MKPPPAQSTGTALPERLSYRPRLASVCDESGLPLIINACPDSIDGLEAELVRRWNCHEEMRGAIQNFISVYAIWEIDPDKSPNTLGVAARQLNAILAVTAKPL